MKVLFDNNVPAPLRHVLVGHEVRTARQEGWQELENGKLLRAAEAGGFDLLVTGDKNIPPQQNLSGLKLAMIVLGTTRWTVLQKHTAPVIDAVNDATPGSLRVLPAPPLPSRRRRQKSPEPQ